MKRNYSDPDEERRKLLKQNRRFEKKLREELGMEGSHTEYNEDLDYVYRHGTRLDRSRILKTDEDNLY